tara:strand:+ start:2955 stop:3371 length:417 start_codon:yes stop_codon:yes gene_type:complete
LVLFAVTVFLLTLTCEAVTFLGAAFLGVRVLIGFNTVELPPRPRGLGAGFGLGFVTVLLLTLTGGFGLGFVTVFLLTFGTLLLVTLAFLGAGFPLETDATLALLGDGLPLDKIGVRFTDCLTLAGMPDEIFDLISAIR